MFLRHLASIITLAILANAAAVSARTAGKPGVPSFSSRGALAIVEVVPSARSVPRRHAVELSVALRATYDNPFDPSQIDLRATVTGPDGRQLVVPGFFEQAYRTAAGTRPVPTGKQGWRVRISPGQPGKYQCVVSATDRTGTVRSAPVQFACTPSDDPGFVRVCRRRPDHFEFESGAPYVPMGINLFVWSKLGAPPPADRLDRCLHWLDELAANGGNFVRLRMDSWWLAIEGPVDPAAGFAGPGWYNQETAWIIDRIYERARQHGVRIMHCVDNANANVNGSSQGWRERYNFYLKKNGGTCERVADFWEDPGAIRNFRNRLRYVVARWGADTGAMCWEFWNEVQCRNDNVDRIAAWHAAMANWLHGLDPWGHPVTTSVAARSPEAADRIWSLPELEINQVHLYNAPDLADAFAALMATLRGKYAKPFFFGEFGPSARDGKMVYDPTGVGLHNGLWAPTFSGVAGPAAFWYIESYMAPRGLFTQFRPLSDFAKSIPWNDPELRPLQAAAPAFPDLPPQLHSVDFTLPTGRRFLFEKPPVTVFDVPSDGQIANADMIRPYLHCNESRKAPPTFRLHMRAPGSFIVHVDRSVGDESNALRVFVDGHLAAERAIPAGREHNPRSTFVAAYKNWKTPYDLDIAVPVPAGVHEVRPEAVGKDRLEVRYCLPDYLCFEKAAPLRLFGFTTPTGAWFWAQNRFSTAGRLQEKLQTPPVPAGMVTELCGLRNGACRIEWWDTWGGAVLDTQPGRVVDGKLRVVFPKIDRDIACRVVQ